MVIESNGIRPTSQPDPAPPTESHSGSNVDQGRSASPNASAIISAHNFGGSPSHPSTNAGGQYTVVKGDNLSEIAQSHGVSLQSLIAANPQIANPNLIFPGQQIHIPGGGGQAGGNAISAASNGGGTSAGGATGTNQAHAGSAVAATSGSKNSPFPPDIVAAAQASQKNTGIPASVTLAQWALESNYGKAMPPGSNNPFGIKAVPGQPSVPARTQEVINGKTVTITANFRKFPSLADAFTAHANLLATSPAYKTARTFENNPNQFANALTGVYATDPSYGSKLISIMKSYNLYQYNQNSPSTKT